MIARMIRKIAAAAAACAVCSTGYGFDGISWQAGWSGGDDRTALLRIGLTSLWRQRQPPQPRWHLAGYWEFFAGIWDNADESTAEVGATPVFRFQRGRLYLEAAIGAHLVQTRISADRTFSTAFQFGTHGGMGMHSGKYDFGLRIQHLSNSSIKQPNPGINFVLLRFQYDLE
jgi:hypothetical protein